MKDHGANYGSVKLELQRVDWYKVFYNYGSFECCEKFKEIINNLISKFVPYKSRLALRKKQICMDEQTTLSKVKMIPSVLENEKPTRLPNVC